jgi:Zn-dependent protease/CBS domain-containing protein
MSGTFQIARLFGIDIKLHFTWLFIFVLLTWLLAESILPEWTEGAWETNVYWIVGVIGSILLFASVLVHELSHSLLAISRGYKVSGITLFFLGGVSEIEEEAVKASEEFWIAVVGPLSSIVLSGMFYGLFILTTGANPQVEVLFQYLAFINLALAIFNLVPAFPLDGGRVLKAVIWQITGNLSRANSIATTAGSMLGFALIGAGVLLVLFTGNFGFLWWVLIGWFIQTAASSTRQHYQVRSSLTGRTVRDAMQPEVPRVEPGITVQELQDEYVTREFQRVYLVSLGDNFQGLVSVSDIKQVPPEERPQKFVTEIMTQAPNVITVSPSDPLDKALEHLRGRDVNQLVVVEDGRPVGLLNRRDILAVLEISELFPQQSGPA